LHPIYIHIKYLTYLCIIYYFGILVEEVCPSFHEKLDNVLEAIGSRIDQWADPSTVDPSWVIDVSPTVQQMRHKIWREMTSSRIHNLW